MRILSVIGTRPEAIKMAMVARDLSSESGIEHSICVTGQHRDMLESVLNVFELQSDYDLSVMKPNQSLSHITTSILDGIEWVISETRPDRVLVQGDTTTTLAAALASFYCKTPVGHVEAGLRSGDVSMPWPEEMNRRLTDFLCDRHYVPTNRARANLIGEGIAESGITVTGNTVIDALTFIVERIGTEPEFKEEVRAALPDWDTGRRLILVTGHRRESFGRGVLEVCDALARIAGREDVEIIYPVHPNPNIREPVYAALGSHRQIKLIPPLDYAPFVYLMAEAHLIITDSGGVQEEAPSLGKPVLVTREVTERAEAVEAGTVKLVGTNADRIVCETTRLLDDADAYAAMAQIHNPYGDGQASKRIIMGLEQ